MSEQEEPWIILTDLAPDQVGPSWYAQGRIELASRPSRAWAGSGTSGAPTPPASPGTALVVSVATLLALAYGTRVEDAQERRIAPGNLQAPPKALARSP